MHEPDLGLHPPIEHFKEIRLFVTSVLFQISDRHLCTGVPEKQVQLLLIAEIMKQQGLADPRLVRDFTHGALLIRILGKYTVAGIQDPLLLFFRQRKKFFIHGISSLVHDQPIPQI